MFVALRFAVGAIVGVVWAVYIAALVALGSCEAFGGRCDGSRPPVLDDDVAVGAFLGSAVATWVLWWLRRPSIRRAAVGVPVALCAGVVVAFLARGIAHG